MHWRSITPTIGVVITLALTSCSSSTASSTPPATSAVATTTTAAGATPPTTGVATTTAPTTAAPTTAAATTAAPTTAAPTTAAPTTVPAPPAVATASTCPDGAPATLTCLTVAVPVDPTAPTGKSINLAVTVRRADPTTWTAPVLSILGTTPIYPWTDPNQSKVFPGHDMIWVDQRGAGRSDGVTDCPDLQTYVAEINTAHLGAPAVAAIKACFANAEKSVVPFATVFDHRTVAADIGTVRRALGISTWALYAGSAGADVALHLVDQEPDTVTAIVTRTPTAVGAGISPNNLAAAFARFAADCAAAPTCKTNGDLQQALATTYARLANPVTSKVTEKVTGVPIVLDQRVLLDSMQSIGSIALAPLVPPRLSAGDVGGSDTAVATAYAEAHIDTYEWVLVAHCQSTDYTFPGLTTTSDDQAGLFKGFTIKPFCDAVGPMPQYPARATPTSKVPVLAVLPSYDPRSSVTTTKQVFSGFADTTIIEVPRIVDPIQQLTDCFYATANAFLAAPGAKLDASCLTSPAVSTLA
jgi:pimeloyl-ACP methyl ester carboxylesterase